MCLSFDKPRIYFYGSGLSRAERAEFSVAMEHWCRPLYGDQSCCRQLPVKYTVPSVSGCLAKMDILCFQNSQRFFRGDGYLHICVWKWDGGGAGGGPVSRDAVGGKWWLVPGTYCQSRGRANSRNWEGVREGAYSGCLLFRSHTTLLPRKFRGTSEQVLRKQKTVAMNVQDWQLQPVRCRQRNKCHVHIRPQFDIHR